MKCANITEAIGNTPVVRLARLFPQHNVWMKIERINPGGSIKDRIAWMMIEDAEHRGVLKKGSIIVEPTSGNTGIGLAMVAVVKGYKVVLVMSAGMSEERRKVMKAYGAKIILTPKEQGTRGAIEKAVRIAKSIPNAWIPFQHANRANIRAHMYTTAQEIVQDFPMGLDCLITASGTGGHISGLAITLKQHFSHLKIYAVEPNTSPIISGGTPSPHTIAGISPGFIPKNLLLETINGVIQVDDAQAFHYTRILPKCEGILAGISTGASLAAVAKYIRRKKPSKTHCIVTINYDLGERYLSVKDLF